MSRQLGDATKDDLVKTLEREVDELRARVADLEALLGYSAPAPIAFDLTRSQERLFGHLMARDIVTTESALAGLYGHLPSGGADAAIIKVMVCKMREKLKPWGVNIKTKWGHGIYMDAESKRRVREIMDAAREEAA